MIGPENLDSRKGAKSQRKDKNGIVSQRRRDSGENRDAIALPSQRLCEIPNYLMEPHAKAYKD